MSSRIISLPQQIIYLVYGSFLVTLFAGGMIIPVFIICCLLIIWRQRGRQLTGLLSRPTNILLIGFLIWLSLSVLWSLSSITSLEILLKLWLAGLLGIMAIYYISFWRETVSSGINNYILLALMILISGILISEHISGYELALFFRKLLGFERYNYGQPMDHATALYTLLLPFCFYHFRNEKKYLMTLSLLSLLVFLFHPMFAAILAVCFAIISACIALVLKRKGVMLLAVISILIILFIPQLMSYLLKLDYFQVISSIPTSWQERLDIWMKTVELINERPILGWGLGTSNRIEELTGAGATSIIQVHPHNIPLQIRLEAGLPGVILFCCLIGMFWGYAYKQTDRAFAGACVASLVIYLSFAMVSFNAWHSWWLSTQYLAILSLLCFKALSADSDITNS